MISIKKILFLLFSLLIIFVGWQFYSNQSATDLRNVPDRSVIEWQLNSEELKVEVVNSAESIEFGLGGREKLDVNDIGEEGMLFVFPEESRPTFWMKGMIFPIDIIWLSEGEIVGVERNVQPPESEGGETELELYLAPQAVDMVLETEPGRVSW